MIMDDCTEPGRSIRMTLVPELARIGFSTGLSAVRVAFQLPYASSAIERASAGDRSPTRRSVAADGANIVRCQLSTSSRVSAPIVDGVPLAGREKGAVLSKAARTNASDASPAVRAWVC